jgi:hypothetical protein
MPDVKPFTAASTLGFHKGITGLVQNSRCVVERAQRNENVDVSSLLQREASISQHAEGDPLHKQNRDLRGFHELLQAKRLGDHINILPRGAGRGPSQILSDPGWDIHLRVPEGLPQETLNAMAPANAKKKIPFYSP